MHVEVKGSSGTSTTVELTAGEVGEAYSPGDFDSLLIVVDQIEWTKEPDGRIATTGGRPRIWLSWAPEEERLTPTSYRYLLPPPTED